MLKINERDGITAYSIYFGNYLIDLLGEYKNKEQIADYDFACNLLKEIFKNINGQYMCSSNGLITFFDILNKKICIDSKTLQKIVVNYMFRKRKQNLLIDEQDAKINYNILFSSFILHEVVHLLQYDIVVNDGNSIFKEIYGLQINKIKNSEYGLIDNIIYHLNHSKYVTEKSANCYSLQIILEVLASTNLISKESSNDFIKIYFDNLIGHYRYNGDEVIGECFYTYKLLGQKKEYQNLVINSDIPLFVKMSNGFTLDKESFDYFNDIIWGLRPAKAKQMILQL